MKTETMKRLLWTGLLSLAAACGDDGLSVDNNRGGGGHGQFQGVELVLAGTDTLIAQWSRQEGWRDADGELLEQLPASVMTDGGPEPLRAGGDAASLDVRLVGDVPLNIEPVDEDAENPCAEYSVRYFPLDDETDFIAWPNVPSPDQPNGPGLFAERADGEIVKIFHCDRLDIYPEREGVAEVEFLLWHVNHADQATDALPVEVLGAAD